MWFWVRRLMGQQPPFFDKYGGNYRNAEKAVDALFELKALMDEKEQEKETNDESVCVETDRPSLG